MKPKRLAAIASAAALSFSVLPAAMAEDVALPAVCGGKAPVLAEGEQLVEQKLYFHGVETVGDVESYQLFAGGEDAQTLSPDAPTSAQPKIDTNGSSTVYPAPLPGNPIMSAWKTYVDDTTRVACFGFNYWAAGDASDMTVYLWPDAAFILGETTPSEATATGEGAGIVEYTSAAGFDTPVVVDSQIYAQIEATTPASILYDSVDYPSSITLVTVQPAPAPEPTPTPTPAPIP